MGNTSSTDAVITTRRQSSGSLTSSLSGGLLHRFGSGRWVKKRNHKKKKKKTLPISESEMESSDEDYSKPLRERATERDSIKSEDELHNSSEIVPGSKAPSIIETDSKKAEEESYTSSETLPGSEDDRLNKDVIFTVANNIGNDLKKLARQLSLYDTDALDLDTIVCGMEEKVHKVLSIWQTVETSKATIRRLSENLEAIGRSDIVQKMKPFILPAKLPVESKISTGSSVELCSTEKEGANILKMIQTRLKKEYRHLEMKGLPWMRDIVLTLKEYYVDLLMNINGKGQVASEQVKIEDIFACTELQKKPVRILVEGGPGSGKTSLAAKLAYDWAKCQSYISHFDLVVLLQLRFFEGTWDNNLSRALSLNNKDKESFLTLINQELFSMLFILDGYDEVSSQTRHEILPLIQKHVYSKSTIIVTSRPGEFTSNALAAEAAADCAPPVDLFLDKQITIKGFNEEQQQMFIDIHMESFPETQKVNVKSKFDKMVDKEVLTCPLFLLMLVVLFTSDKEMEDTKTKTGLYKHVFNLIIRRYFSKSGLQGVDEIDLFSVIRALDPPHYLELMSQFSEFALKALRKNDLIFSRDDIVVLYKCDPKILELGFLMPYVSKRGFREILLYEPVHISLLEFAAAYGLYFFYERHQYFPSSTDIISLQPSKKSNLFFPFLSGLMGNNAGVLFDIIHSYAFEYTYKFEVLYPCLHEINLTESILKSLTSFLPPKWNIHSDHANKKTGENNFLTSTQHQVMLEWGVQQGNICHVTWDILQGALLPTSVVMDTLVLDMRQVYNIHDLAKQIHKSTHHDLNAHSKNKLHCKYLWCSFSESVCETGMSLNGFFDLLQYIDFELISFDFSSTNTKDDFTSQTHDFEPFSNILSAVENGTLKRAQLHSMNVGIYTDYPTVMRSVNRLVNLDKVEVLELHVEGMTQIGMDVFIAYAAESINLRTVVLSTSLGTLDVESLPFVVNLTTLCNSGQKSWKWVELSGIKVDCDETIVAAFLIQHLQITCYLLPHRANKLMQHCQTKSLICAASLLSDTLSHWRCQTYLTELNITVDASLLYRGLSSLTEKLQNLQILALTMSSFKNVTVSLPMEEWIHNAISFPNLKGIEIWKFSKNIHLATELVAGVIKCLENQLLSPLSHTVHSRHEQKRTLPPSPERLCLQYLMINDEETENGLSATYFQRLKKCLQYKLLQRIEVVFPAETRVPEYGSTGCIFSKYSINNVFPRLEGFKVEHDLWGSREDDSIYSKGKYRISLKQKDRLSITYKRTHTGRRSTVPIF